MLKACISDSLPLLKLTKKQHFCNLENDRPNADMRFWLPDYEKRLIGELQKQQHGAQFCDTRLQTEGISIPTHSCILGALSLQLSQRLSTLPPPPAGQKRTLHLHTLKPQTLIKLIGLLYSGELEVTCASEQKDLLAAAHLFGLSDLVVGEKEKVRNRPNGCKECCTKVEIEKRDAQIQVSPRCFRASIGTQSITQELTQTMDSSSQCEDTSLPLPVPQSCKNAETSTSTRSSSKGCSEGEAILELSTNSSVSVSCPSEIITLHLSPSEDSSLQEVEASAGCIGASPEVEEEGKHRQMSHNNYKTGSLEPAVAQKRQVCKTVASKSMEKMQEMMETTQISIKVKLRRRTKEEMWEVVNLQDPNALVTPMRSNNSKRPSGEFTAVRLSSAQSSDPHTSSPNESMSAFSDDAVPLRSPRPVEETDEQIEKLLEDIMIGLNILPNNDKDKAKSRHQKLSHRQGSTHFQKGKYSYFGCYENDGVQRGNCSAGESSGCVQAPVSPPIAFRDLNPNSSRARHSPENSPCSTTSRETNPDEDPKDLELLPLSTENEDNLFSMADLQFLPCLSPLDSNNNSTTVNKSPVHSYLPGRAWLMDNPTSLQFPLTAVEQKPQDAYLKPSTSEEKFGKDDLDALPPIRQQKNRRNLDDKVTPQSVKRKCPNLGLNKTYKDVNVKTDANINLSHCLVSLSSNNVLAKERNSVSSTPPHNESPPSDGSKPQTPIRRRLRAKTQAIGDSLRKLPDRTRRKSNRSESTPDTPSPEVQKCEEKRKRGRPAKRKRQKKNPNPSLEISDEPTSDPKRPRLEEAPKRCPSRKTRKTVHADHSYTAKEEGNKRPPMVSLKEFQQLFKRQHLKEKRSQKDETEGEAVAESSQQSDSAHSQSAEVYVMEDKDGQSQTTSTEDLNHLNSLEEPPQADDSSITECDVSEVSDQSEMCFGVIPKEVIQLSEEMEGQRAPPEEQATPPKKFNDCAPDCACENQVSSDDSLPLTATNEEENPPTNDWRNVEDQNRSSGDEEVDILIHSSPDQTAPTEGPKPVHISADEEEEEEDGDEVDVTGSETDG